MKRKEILHLLNKYGWLFHRHGKGSHQIWRHPNGRQMTVAGLNSTADYPPHKSRALTRDITLV